MRHTLEPARGASAILQRACDYFELVAECQPAGNGSERIVDVGRANQWRMKFALTNRSLQIEVHALERKLRISCGYVCV